jgi:hypothetical protein
LNLPGGFHAIHVRHDDVHQDHIGLKAPAHADGFLSITRFADQFEIIEGAQKSCDSFADDIMVIDD